MNMRNMMATFTQAVSGATVCWIRDEDDNKVSVMAILHGSTSEAKNASLKLATRAKDIASWRAGKIGHILSTGVFMGGDGNGSVMATGIADISLTPEVERRLIQSGIPQLR
jgi:hypothetical protein